MHTNEEPCKNTTNPESGKSGEIRIRMLVGALKCKYYVKRHGKRKKIKISTEGEFIWMKERKKNCVHKWKNNT